MQMKFVICTYLKSGLWNVRSLITTEYFVKREELPLEAAQMTFWRHLLGITKLDKAKNQSIREKHGVQNVVKEIKQYQQKWLQHVQMKDTNRITKQALQYRPKGQGT